MSTLNLLVAVCTAYVFFLFFVAFAADRLALQGKKAWLRSPLIYTLSLSIYCTAWTFYGAVGSAARNGFEYLTIYLGPTIVMVSWWWLLRKLIRIGRTQKITSIADLISSRYGKSSLLAAGVTILAVIGTTPYIALQLQSVTLSFSVFAAQSDGLAAQDQARVALWLSLGLAVFTVLFGTRNLDAKERHDGVVMAIAVEAVVKLVALLSVGIFVVWGVSGGLTEALNRIDASEFGEWHTDRSRWAGLIFLSAAAFLCLPRTFQVLVVENDDESHLRTASWAFPLYLCLISLFVVPIAVVGLDIMPDGSNPDLFVLTIPACAGRKRVGDAVLPWWVQLRHFDGDRRGNCIVDHGVEPHRDAHLAATAPKRGQRIRRRPGCRSHGATDLHRWRGDVGLSVFPTVQWRRSAGLHWPCGVLWSRAGLARDAGWHVLAWSHTDGGVCRTHRGLCDLALYALPAQLWCRNNPAGGDHRQRAVWFGLAEA